MAAVAYKLLPLSEYQELKREGNSCETPSAAAADYQHERKQHHPIDAGNHEKGSQQRTIGDIQKKFVANIKESQSYPSRIPDAPDAAAAAAATTGYGTPPPTTVSYLHTDARSLPQYSQQTRLQQSFKNYTDLLETNDIPLHLKMPLLEYYNQKFANSKNGKRGAIITSSDDEGSDSGDESNNNTHYQFQAERGVAVTLPHFLKGKWGDAKRILTQLGKHHKHIRWNSLGHITKPVIRRSSVKDLTSLLDILVHKTKGDRDKWADVTKLLLPILPAMREFILNTRLLSYVDNRNKNTTVQRAITKQMKKKLEEKKNIKYQTLF